VYDPHKVPYNDVGMNPTR